MKIKTQPTAIPAADPVVPAEVVDTVRPSAETDRKLANFAHRKTQLEKAGARAKSAKSTAVYPPTRAIKRDAASTHGLPALPKLPKAARKPKPPKPCECGCGGQTRGGRFLPGHDARLHAWALRVERGHMKANEVPAPHTAAVAAYLKTRKAK
jgi:hypothetical protein